MSKSLAVLAILLFAGAAHAGPCLGVAGLGAKPGLRTGERLEYELTLEGAYMGRLELSVGDVQKNGGTAAIPLFGRIRTNAFVSAVKPVQGRYQTMVDPSSLTPIGVQVEGTVGEDERWERVRFIEDGRKVETAYRFLGREGQQVFAGEHALLDGLSLLHIARSLPLETGIVACQDVLSTRRLWRVEAEVMAKEAVETPVGPKPAHRIRTTFTRLGTSSPIEIDVLLGDQPGRPPLAFEMRQGKYTGRARLIRWHPGRPS